MMKKIFQKFITYDGDLNWLGYLLLLVMATFPLTMALIMKLFVLHYKFNIWHIRLLWGIMLFPFVVRMFLYFDKPFARWSKSRETTQLISEINEFEMHRIPNPKDKS